MLVKETEFVCLCIHMMYKSLWCACVPLANRYVCVKEREIHCYVM